MCWAYGRSRIDLFVAILTFTHVYLHLFPSTAGIFMLSFSNNKELVGWCDLCNDGATCFSTVRVSQPKCWIPIQYLAHVYDHESMRWLFQRRRWSGGSKQCADGILAVFLKVTCLRTSLRCEWLCNCSTSWHIEFGSFKTTTCEVTDSSRRLRSFLCNNHLNNKLREACAEQRTWPIQF